METISYIIMGALIVVSPGADFILVLKNSLGNGRKAGIVTGLGIGSGVCIHITYSILGVSHLLSHNPMLFSLIKYLGSAYLIYLGITAVFSSKLIFNNEIEVQKNHQAQRYFMQGFLCNLLNPKTMLFFLSVFSQLVSPGSGSNVPFVLSYGVYISVLHAVWFCFVAFFVTSEKILAVFKKIERRVNQACGTGLVVFGAILAFGN